MYSSFRLWAVYENSKSDNQLVHSQSFFVIAVILDMLLDLQFCQDDK